MLECAGGYVGGLCDYSVTPVPIGLGLGFGTALGLGLGLRGPDLGLGLDNYKTVLKFGCIGPLWLNELEEA